MSRLSHRPSNPVYYIEDWWIFCNHFLQCEYGWAAGYQEIGKEACLHLSSSNGLLLFILYTRCSRDYFALSSKTLMLLPTFSFSFLFFLCMHYKEAKRDSWDKKMYIYAIYEFSFDCIMKWKRIAFILLIFWTE